MDLAGFFSVLHLMLLLLSRPPPLGIRFHLVLDEEQRGREAIQGEKCLGF